MAYTYNDVQNPTAVHALGDVADETLDEGSDMARWAAVQQAYAMSPTDLGTKSVLSSAEMSIDHISSVSKAASKLSEAQSVANIHHMNDSFIRDSITGK